MAKFDPPNSRTMAKLIPITLPSLLKSVPPDPPFGDGNPVGQKIEVKAVKNPIRPPLDASFEIIGVGGDVKNFGPQQPANPMAFIPNTIRGSFMLLLKTTVEPALLVHAVEAQVWSVDPDEIVGLRVSPTAYLRYAGGCHEEVGRENEWYSSCTVGSGGLLRKPLKRMEPTRGLKPLTCRLRIDPVLRMLL
jgi:hypothetical protein